MTKKTFKKIASQFPSKRCVVIGDVMIDEWIWGNVSRISPEAPVPVVDVTKRTFTAGGASNVAANLRTLGAQVSVLGVVGRDEPGRILRRELKKHKIATHGLLALDDRPTTQKTRIIAHSQQVVRADFERREQLNGSFLRRFIGHLRQDLNSADLVVISDYGKGVVTDGLLSAVKKMLKDMHIPLVVGPKPEVVPFCRGVTALTLNQHESSIASGHNIKDKKSLEFAGKTLLRNTGSDAVLITRGAEGMSLFRQEGQAKHLPAHASQVYDVSGAGDTVLAVFALTLACGWNWTFAMELANLAASVVVRKVGTATAEVIEIEDVL